MKIPALIGSFLATAALSATLAFAAQAGDIVITTRTPQGQEKKNYVTPVPNMILGVAPDGATPTGITAGAGIAITGNVISSTGGGGGGGSSSAQVDLAGGTTLAAGTEYFDTFAANRTFSAITGTVVEGSVIKIEMNVTVAMAITFTPSVYRYGESGTAGPIAFSPGTHFVQLKRSGGVWRLGDSATPLNKLNATTAPTTGDDAADGYAVGSLWIDQTADLVYHCVDSTVGAAVWKGGGQRDVWVVPIGDETTAITTGTGKVTFRAPYACTITGVRASLTTASSSGIPTFNIKEGGTTIFSTSLTVASGAKTSVGGTPAVLSDTAFSDDAEITIDVTTAGTGAAGAKVSIYVTR